MSSLGAWVDDNRQQVDGLLGSVRRRLDAERVWLATAADHGCVELAASEESELADFADVADSTEVLDHPGTIWAPIPDRDGTTIGVVFARKRDDDGASRLVDDGGMLDMVCEVIAEQYSASDHGTWVQESTDELTGAVSRAGAWAQLEELESRGGGFCAVFCVIEAFDDLVEQLGRGVGDSILREVARRLERAARADDTVARWGGNEFLVLTGPLPADDVRALESRLKAAVEDTSSSSAAAARMAIEVTIGSARCDRGDRRSIDRVLRDADHSTYTRRRDREDDAGVASISERRRSRGREGHAVAG